MPETTHWREVMAQLDVPAVKFCTTSDGVRIAYTVAGEGPPFINCSGVMGAHALLNWKLPVLRRGLEEMYKRNTCYLFDWRNTGLSEQTDQPFSIETAMRDLEAVINETGDGPVSIRMNASAELAVLPYAVAHPERIHRLATFNVAFGPPPVEKRDKRRAAYDIHRRADGHNIVARSLVGWHEHELAEQWEEMLLVGSSGDYRAQTMEICDSLNIRDRMPLVRSPILITQRRELPGHPTVAEGIEAAAAFPNGRLLLVEGANYDCGSHEDSGAATMAFINGDDLATIGHLPSPPPGVEDPLEVATTAGRATAVAEADGPARLTVREREVLCLVARGKTNQQIAESLALSRLTVDRHVANIYLKADLHNRVEATLWAVVHGLVAASTSDTARAFAT